MLIYQRLVKRMLVAWCHETAYLALDTTQLWKQSVIIRLALIYCGRAIPLDWVVCAGGSPTVVVARYQRMLAQVAAHLPVSTKAILLADRGSGHIDLMKIATQMGRYFRIRFKGDTWVYLANRRRRQVKALMPLVGKGRGYAFAWITDQPYGPLHLAIAQVITPSGTEKWAITSDDPVGGHTLDEYGMRFDLEDNFLDDKSTGFNLVRSQPQDSMAVSRLCLILAAAIVYLISNGSAVVTCCFRPVVDTHWRRVLSYL